MKLIDSTQLILSSKNDKFVTMEEIIHAPGIDPVHTTSACYCKECKYCYNLEIYVNDKKSNIYYCDYFFRYVKKKDFCSFGELKKLIQ